MKGFPSRHQFTTSATPLQTSTSADINSTTLQHIHQLNINSTPLQHIHQLNINYDRLMVRVTEAAGDPAQMRILGDEAAALTQAGRDRFAA